MNNQSSFISTEQGESLYTTTQQPSELPSYEFSLGGYVKAVSMLFFILALLVVFMLLLKRKTSVFTLSHNIAGYFTKRKYTKPRKTLPLIVEQRYTIDQRKSLLVVHFLNKTLLLGVTDASIQVLEESLEKGTSTHEDNVATFNAHLEGLGKSDSTTTTL